MNNGFIRVAAATPKIKVAYCDYNADRIIEKIDEAVKNKAQLLVLPELCITGYTCNDLFWQSSLIEEAKNALNKIAEHTINKEIAVVVGLPLKHGQKLYNVAALIYDGIVWGYVPKSYIPNYSEFYEARHFSSGADIFFEYDSAGDVIFPNTCDQSDCEEISSMGKIPFGCGIIFNFKNIENFKLGIEICEDLWVPNPPSTACSMAGATVIANLSASDENTGKDIYRRNLVSGQSARTISAYVYADAGEGESTTDLVFAAHNLIAENGNIVSEAKRFGNETIYADIDLSRLSADRRRMSTFIPEHSGYVMVDLDLKPVTFELSRYIDKAPFVPSAAAERNKRCEEILHIQSMGLKKRLEHTGTKTAVVGISGGLDSTLALLVTVRAFDMLGLDRKGIIAVTMPGFGTTDRTYHNGTELIREIGVTFKEVNISEAVNLHLKQIEHDSSIHDVTYENAQARQRTYLLMDIANENSGLVIGTGDMSEMALGWATYNGDHMSMYGVNCGVPKTLVRHLVCYYADTCGEEKLSDILGDILDTPVSPELLPPEKGKISQKTEELVGPYELHDFFLYYVLRFGYEPEKIFFLAVKAFEEDYSKEEIKKWLITFYKRFFSQQFKRSCVPDGPKVGSVALSPRGDLRMPSDGCADEWIKRAEKL